MKFQFAGEMRRAVDLMAAGQWQEALSVLTYRDQRVAERLNRVTPAANLWSTSSVQAIANNTLTAVSLGSVQESTYDDMTATAHTVTILEDGLYFVRGRVMYAANGTGYRRTEVRSNGTPGTSLLHLADQAAGWAGGAHGVSVASIESFTAGTTLRLFCTQTSGGNLNIGNSDGRFGNQLIVFKLGIA